MSTENTTVGELSVDLQAQFCRGFFIGISLTAICACIIAYGINAQLFLLHETLIAGALTIVAGFLPVAVIYRQIVVTVKLAKTEREGRLVRARALLSMPLLDLSDYASRSSSMLLSHYPRSGDIVHRNESFPSLPELPRDAINTIAETCGFAEEKTIVDSMAKLITVVQVQRSRVAGVFDVLYGGAPHRLIPVSDLEDYMINSLEIAARCACMFAYARFESENVDALKAGDMRLQARLAHITQSNVFEKIQRRYGASV